MVQQGSLNSYLWQLTIIPQHYGGSTVHCHQSLLIGKSENFWFNFHMVYYKNLIFINTREDYGNAGIESENIEIQEQRLNLLAVWEICKMKPKAWIRMYMRETFKINQTSMITKRQLQNSKFAKKMKRLIEMRKALFQSMQRFCHHRQVQLRSNIDFVEGSTL